MASQNASALGCRSTNRTSKSSAGKLKIQSREIECSTDLSQNYYNAPNGDPLAQQTDLDVFFNLYEPLNDAMDAARCMGSGFIARHTALADIGGWPLIDVGEDFMLSSCFHRAGWKTAYVGEKVQWGLAPESLCTHLKQKKRWVSKTQLPLHITEPDCP